MIRLPLRGLVLAVLGLAVAAAPAWADFTISPENRTGHVVTFMATSPSPLDSWDLDGDGVYGDKYGSPVTWVYASPGPVTVGLQEPDSSQSTHALQLNGPSAAFVSFPQSPFPGEQVTFVYSSSQATPADAPPEWDLNGDGVKDATGTTVSRSFPAPGVYSVGLRVSDLDGAISSSTKSITVRPFPVAPLGNPAPPRLMAPFPIIRITGKIGRRGAKIRRLTIGNAPNGSTVTVRCHGRGCPFRLSSRTVSLAGRPGKPQAVTIRIRKLEGRLLRSRTTVKVYVSKAGTIGKFTRFKIRRGRPPLRSDLCLVPGKASPVACPQA